MGVYLENTLVKYETASNYVACSTFLLETVVSFYETKYLSRVVQVGELLFLDSS